MTPYNRVPETVAGSIVKKKKKKKKNRRPIEMTMAKGDVD